MKVEVKKSGNKITLKVTPGHIEEIIPLTNMFRRLPDNAKGTRNPIHWHIKIRR